MKVEYALLQCGQLPVFGRPDHHHLYTWKPGPGPTSWKRVLRQDNMDRVRASGRWERVESPKPGDLNFVVEFLDKNAGVFGPYLESAARKLPGSRRGRITVVIGWGCVPAKIGICDTSVGPLPSLDIAGTEPEYLWFGMVYAPRPWNDDLVGKVPKGFEKICPQRI